MPVKKYKHRLSPTIPVGSYIWLKLDGDDCYRQAQVLEHRRGVQELGNMEEGDRVNSIAQGQGVTIDFRGMVAGSELRQRRVGYRIRFEEPPYTVHQLSEDEINGDDPATKIAYEQYGKLVKLGTGTLTTSIIDAFSFITALEIIFNAVYETASDKETAKQILYSVGAVWALPVFIVGGRQVGIAINDWQYRNKFESVTMTADGLLNMASAVTGLTGSIMVARNPATDLSLLQQIFTLRAATGLWSATQFIDMVVSLKKIYDWYNTSENERGAISPEVITALKTFVTLVGGAGLTATAGTPQVILTAIAAGGSLIGGTSIAVAKHKVKQD